MCPTVHQFFKRKPILKVANHTFITLIPKTPKATEIGDLRSTSCVNLIYKMMTKILTDIKAFIERRLVHDNTFLTDEMVYGFGRK